MHWLGVDASMSAHRERGHGLNVKIEHCAIVGGHADKAWVA